MNLWVSITLIMISEVVELVMAKILQVHRCQKKLQQIIYQVETIHKMLVEKGRALGFS